MLVLQQVDEKYWCCVNTLTIHTLTFTLVG
jgi:hypothetical protein